MAKIMRFLAKTEPRTITAKDGDTKVSTFLLEETTGKFSNSYAATWFGEPPALQTGRLVIVDFRFLVHEKDGHYYQDCVINEIVPLG